MDSRLASKSGFGTKHWGPSGWRLIHLAALNFPIETGNSGVSDDVRDGYYMFFKSLCHILPCGVCRTEFCKMVNDERHPLFLHAGRFARRRGTPGWDTRFRLFQYTVELHDAVAVRLGKSRKPFSFWLNKYLSMRSKPTSTVGASRRSQSSLERSVRASFARRFSRRSPSARR